MRLIIRFIVILIIVAGSHMAKAQFVSERSALHNITKEKWTKAKRQLKAISDKDSIHAGAEYAWSRYFFAESNPDFQIDSAYSHIQQALADYLQTLAKERRRLLKIEIDSNALVFYKQRIDSAAFARAREANTEDAYLFFLSRFETANQRAEAMALRDEVAFARARTENTYQSFLAYIEKYPESRFASEAKVLYDRLLFESKTANQKLATFESFLAQYPETPYRNEIEQQIFEKMTAGGEAVSFERFIRKYPTSIKVKMAKNILYHLVKEDERALIPILVTDSIRQVQAQERQYLVPFLKNDRFGFMNEHGEERIKASLTEISDAYRCGNIMDEVLIGDGKILSRSGEVLAKTQADEVEPLGYGFLVLENETCVTILHASGFSPAENACLQEAKLLAKNYLLLKKSNHWSVWTLTGRQLMPYEWDEIQLVGETVAFKKNGKLRLIKMKDLAKIADQQVPVFSKEYDEIKQWNDGRLWVKSGKEEAVLTQALNEWVKPANQQITQTFFGAVSQTAAGYMLYDKLTGPSEYYYRVKVQQPWVLAQQNGEWHSIDLNTKTNLSQAFDSVGFVGPFFVGIKTDTMHVHFFKNATLTLPPVARVQFLPGKDSLFFLLVEEAGKKTVYNTKAEKLFTIQAEKIEHSNGNYFTLTQKKKTGLISINGKIILNPEYDALGAIVNNRVATLKERKFGLVDLTRKIEIKPVYDKNITAYNPHNLVVFKDNMCALIDWNNKLITPFEFEEIVYWSDSSALVKKHFQWMIYNFIDKKIVVDNIKAYKWVRNTPEEKLMIIQQENTYGVLSNIRGMVIPATFSDIVNVGSASNPLYFTEKHVEEASIFVVIYYDKNGAQLRKYVYEGSDYEKIYCSGR